MASCRSSECAAPNQPPHNDKATCICGKLACVQGELAFLEGISLAGLRAEVLNFQALSRMPQLRILILDGIKTQHILSSLHLPRLAMLSWQDFDQPSVPFAFNTMKSAAVLGISDC